jgi:hypothetical protein
LRKIGHNQYNYIIKPSPKLLKLNQTS